MKTIKRSAAALLCVLSAFIFCLGTSAAGSKTVYLGGMPFGVRVFNGRLTVNGFGEVDAEGGNVSPAKDAGFREDDIIKKVDGRDVGTALDITQAVLKSEGRALEFTVQRQNSTLTLTVVPALSESSGEYRIGLWLRDGTAGIGTLTYIIPETGAFGGLGHGICDSATGKLCDLGHGIVSDVTVNGVKRGAAGDPGELKGIFSAEKSGTVTLNTDHGVFGIFADVDKLGADAKTIEIAEKDDFHRGDAVIYCTLDESGVKEYAVKVDKAGSGDPAGSFLVEICDKALIEKTGGIVQGMSGSPVVQDGKLIGAVTHVLVSDPTRGYGIYIEDMMDSMPDILKSR